MGEAEPLEKQVLADTERILGRDHPDTIARINNLARLYDTQGRYDRAEPLFKQALDGPGPLPGGANAKAVRRPDRWRAWCKVSGAAIP